MRSIWVTFQKEGVHLYPGADTDPKLATGDWDDVSFLGFPHRHIERLYTDVESSTSVLQLDHKSCEMIADELANMIHEKYPNRNIRISVAEDNENGCEMEYPRHSFGVKSTVI